MKRNRVWLGMVICLLAALSLNTSAAGETLLGTAFTYQGRLEDGGAPASGLYDFRFILYNADSGGSQVGGTLERGDVTVTDGYFTLQMDFGPVFGDQTLWLEVSMRPGASTGSYTVLQPRQPLTGTPFALYARAAPWSGLSGVPAGFSDGMDNDTTYSAGTGLALNGTTLSADTVYLQRRITGVCGAGNSVRQINADGTVTCEVDDNTTYTSGAGLSLAGGQFSVNFTGPGTATTAARSDHTHNLLAHNHLGETWPGIDNPLLIEGNFYGTDHNAPLVLKNNGIGDGLEINRAGSDGVFIKSANMHGVAIDWAGGHGLFIDSTDSTGILINSAGWHGLQVQTAGNPSTWVLSNYKDGVAIGGAEGNGVEIGRADVVGVYVLSAGYDGVVVGKAGTPLAPGSQSSANNGIEVRSAQGNGVWVGRADVDGIDATGTIYAGDFHGHINVNGTVYGAAQGVFAINTGSRALEPGEFVAVRGVRQDTGMGAPLVLEVGPVEEGGAVIGVVQARAEQMLEEQPVSGEGEQATQAVQLVPGEGAAEPGVYLSVITYGVIQARVSPESASLKAGDRLAAGADGLVRGLLMVEVNGVLVAESAPVVGVVLDEPGADGLVWILVNPK